MQISKKISFSGAGSTRNKILRRKMSRHNTMGFAESMKVSIFVYLREKALEIGTILSFVYSFGMQF